MERTLTILVRAVTVASMALTLAVVGHAANGTIHTFATRSRGILPFGPVTADANGNLYGTAYNGGVPGGPSNNCSQYEDGCGLVYKLTPSSTGWSYSVIHVFRGSPADGQNPTDALTIDSAGNIFGTTTAGGSHLGGTVYELIPSGSGSYTEKILYNFKGAPIQGNTDGYYPNGVILDSMGNLFGTTTYGGSSPQFYGTAYELSPGGNGAWIEKVIYNFGFGTDGINPRSRLLTDNSGNLFGTAMAGGVSGTGAVFELSPSAGPAWTETFLYSFGPMGSGDGCGPGSSLVSDAAGNLFGTTSQCGGMGTVFELSPSAGGLSEKIIHHFLNASSGSAPSGPVTFDASGNLFGTTSLGGVDNWGVVYKLTAPAPGAGWVESPVHVFTGGPDGAGPGYGVILGPSGKLFGTTTWGGFAGGTDGFGVVFEYNP